MPPPPPHSSLGFFLLPLFLLLSDVVSGTKGSCFLSHFEASSCPPFKSSPPFPFSPSPGCGHPAFHLQCASPHSIISVNNVSFSVIRYEPNSSSLLLSPHRFAAGKNCSAGDFEYIPNRPINLTGSPFQVSDASCSRVSKLRPCSPPNLPNCSHCPWECKLIKNPLHLLHGCGSDRGRFDSGEGCQRDVLGFLDELLSNGIEVDWDSTQDSYFSNCSSCRSRNGVCGFNSSDPDRQFLCFPAQSRISPEENPNRITILSSIFTLTFLLLMVAVAASIFRSRRLKSAAAGEDPTTVFLHRHRSASLLPPVYTYEELETSTNRFDPKRKIGDGGFGSVYLGQLYDGRIVAVKYLHRNHHYAAAGKAFSTKSFCNEILILSSIHHSNLVKLHGYCSDPRGLLLVYDYVPNGTLADHLHGPYRKGTLTWQVRIDIALQTAMAIEYLHFAVSPPIVHRDVTSANIFVEKDMRIKVGDFGLSRLLIFPETTSSATSSSECVWTGPQGTPGYLDPDYHRSFRLTEKSDVYSFGVVLLELVSGLKAVDQTREKREMGLADLAVSRIQMGLLRQVVDPVLVNDGDAMDGVEAVAELAFRCVAADKDDRPDAREIVEELKRVRNRTRVLRGSNSNSSLVSVGGSDPVSVCVSADLGKV